MARSTRATKFLEEAGIAFTLHAYDYDEKSADLVIRAAKALGVAPELVLKTLIFEVDGEPVCAILSSDRQVSLKKLAAAFGGRRGEICRPEVAERVSGYNIGGISPFGMRRRLRTAIDEQTLVHQYVFINAGQRGLDLRLDPREAARLLSAIVTRLSCMKRVS